MLSGPADLVMFSFLICSETILSVTRNSFISLLHGDISIVGKWLLSSLVIIDAKYFENVSRIKSLSSVILDSVDSELTCISVISFCMLSLLFIYFRSDNGLRLCLHIDSSGFYFLLFSVIFLVSSTDGFFFSKVHVDLLSFDLCVIFQIRRFQVFLFHCYCKAAVTV